MQTEHGMSDESDVPLSAYITKPRLKEEDNDPPLSSKYFRITKSKLKVCLFFSVKPEIVTADEIKPMALEEAETVDAPQHQESSLIHSCHVCQASFNRVNHLTRHMTLHRALLVHKCGQCDKAFATEDHLARHTDQDHVDRPYICTVCNKVFNRGEHLIRHLRVVHIEEGTQIERVLKCSICEKTFSR